MKSFFQATVECAFVGQTCNFSRVIVTFLKMQPMFDKTATRGKRNVEIF